jgi:tetratricopeptide (TPR) repeat protein
MQVNMKLGILTTLLIAFHFLGLCQETIKLFPKNINIDEYIIDNCYIDTVKIKEQIIEKDFFGEYGNYTSDFSSFKIVDLNNDGNCEFLHYYSSSVFGWPYDFLSIYKVTETSITKIFDMPNFLLQFAEPHNDYLQINYGYLEGHKTNPIYFNSVWRFDGYKYSTYYSPHLTKGEFKEAGLTAFKNKDYHKALIHFNNALLTPHHSQNANDLLLSANDVAITLIRLDKFDEVIPLLSNYSEKASDNNAKAAAYYNIGLALENLNDIEKALQYFEMSCKHRETNACNSKIKKYKR